MTGGLMNLVSQGQQNILLNGNPSKTFFKAAYSKYTNFGLQKFRVDYEGSKTLRLTEESTFTFKIPRYADLLMDTYISLNLPSIWSPIYPPCAETGNKWAPYEFKWIPNIGAQMISNITITCGNQKLQEYSGSYIVAQNQRDLNGTKQYLFDQMSGNVLAMTDPGNSGTRVNSYPSSYYTTDTAGPEPSIRGRTIYIPLSSWFTNKTQRAFPLICLQYNELFIHVTFRPINQLFQIRDVFDPSNNYPYVAPNFNLYYMQFYRFLQPPPDVDIGINSYTDQRTLWNVDVNLNCTYCFLSNDESRLFALNEQKYLFKQVYQKVFYNVTGPNKVDLDSLGMVSSYMFYFQRSDANLRNEWSNYTNWPYGYLPQDLSPAPVNGIYPVTRIDATGQTVTAYVGPGVNPSGVLTGFMTTGTFSQQNAKDILISLGILIDGIYRENIQPGGVFSFLEKYYRTPGAAPSGLYCYNFCMDSSSLSLVNQPSGAMNMSQYTSIQFEFTTITPPLDPMAQVLTICDPDTGLIIGVNKPSWIIYDYNFNLYVFEERINMVSFVGGNCALSYAT